MNKYIGMLSLKMFTSFQQYLLLTRHNIKPELSGCYLLFLLPRVGLFILMDLLHNMIAASWAAASAKRTRRIKFSLHQISFARRIGSLQSFTIRSLRKRSIRSYHTLEARHLKQGEVPSTNLVCGLEVFSKHYISLSV